MQIYCALGGAVIVMRRASFDRPDPSTGVTLPMYHSNPTYIRKGKTIRHVEGGAVEEFKSISAAKRRSREMQQQSHEIELADGKTQQIEGKLGDGWLRVAG